MRQTRSKDVARGKPAPGGEDRWLTRAAPKGERTIPKEDGATQNGSGAPQGPSRVDLWICLGLFVAAVALYASVSRFDFVNFDDPEYVAGNPHVRAGVTLSGILWALTSSEAANWYPVTRLSHMLDVQLFGLASGRHHLTNVLFHALATLLLFAFLRRATSARRPSAWVALIFALHPLHVESVAWVAERKDVLCAFFWFLTLWTYARYVETRTRGRYVLVVAAFALGLMSKPMIVTLPLVLLLLDIWPLRRTEHRAALIREKLPLFVMSAASAVVTLVVQRSAGAAEAIHASLMERVSNALVSYAAYIAKMLWPAGLAVFYPFPASLPMWQPVLAGFLIAAITAAVYRWRREVPYLLSGWLWFVVTLLPVIGLVQVGAQARADRYLYVPMVGLLVMLAWGVAAQRKQLAMALAAITALACVPAAWAQIQTWRNSESLFEHALQVTEGNYLAHHNLGVALALEPGRLPDAIAHYEAALRIQPNSARAHTDLGSALARIPGRLNDAVAEFQAALRISPDSAIPHNDLGNALSKVPGRLADAIAEYEAALRLNPDYAEAHNNLGSALARSGRVPEAIAQYETALRLNPEYAEARVNLGSALANMPGRQADAMAAYREALRIDPGSAEAHNRLGSALAQSPGHLPDAIAEYEAALQLKPDYAEAHANLGSALAEIPARVAEALAEYQAALRIDPGSAETHYNFGVTLSKIEGRAAEAVAEFEAALRIDPNYAEAHSNLGVVLSNQPGRLSDAIAHFEAALRIRPDYADAHYNLGVALSNVPGRMPQAITHFEAALRLKPDPELRQLVERLRAGR